MDVAFVNRPLGMRRGGGEMWDIEMARALDSMGLDVTIYTGKPLTGDLEKPVDLPLRTVRSPFLYDLSYAAPIGIGGVIGDIDRQLFITQIARHLEDRHDIVHVNAYPEFLRIAERVDCPMTIKLNGPPHSLFYDYIHPWKSSYSWLKRAEAVITTGTTTESVAENGIDPITINPGVDTDLFSPEGPVVGTSGTTILWVGRFVPAKNLSDLVDAFAAVLDEHPDADLWLVGEGALRDRIESRAESLGIRDAVRFCGYVPNDELPAYYRAADVFALSSKTENHPIALMEAMSCGRPVVAPQVGWIPKMLNDGHDAQLVPPEDSDELAMALLQGIENGGEIDQRARETAVTKFSWGGRASRLKTVLDGVVS